MKLFSIFTYKVIRSFVMIRLVILLTTVNCVLSTSVYIDRSTLDWNKQFGNWSTTFTHDAKRNCIVNLTFDLYKPVLKFLLYVKVNLAEHEHDREYKREFLRTVFDFEKALNESQKNFIVLAFMKNVKKFTDFDLRFPLQPVRCFLP